MSRPNMAAPTSARKRTRLNSTLFPYTPLFRSRLVNLHARAAGVGEDNLHAFAFEGFDEDVAAKHGGADFRSEENTPELHPLPLHAALPISIGESPCSRRRGRRR